MPDKTHEENDILESSLINESSLHLRKEELDIIKFKVQTGEVNV